jgi:hypothetical protein
VVNIIEQIANQFGNNLGLRLYLLAGYRLVKLGKPI